LWLSVPMLFLCRFDGIYKRALMPTVSRVVFVSLQDYCGKKVCGETLFASESVAGTQQHLPPPAGHTPPWVSG
jgi:hypothetical protein